MKLLFNFVTLLIGGDIAPIGYVLGIVFSVIGILLIANVEQTNQIIGSGVLCLTGVVILFFRIRRDVIEIRNQINADSSK